MNKHILKQDIKYMITNSIVNRIPSWSIRKAIYKLFGMKIGTCSRIGIGTIIVNPRGIIIGNHVIVNEYCFLDGRGKITIGDNSSISIYTKLVSASHLLNSNDFEYQTHPIVIEDHVFIGTNATILENTLLRKGCCIGAGAVAKGEYEEASIYIGNPAKKYSDRQCDNSYELTPIHHFR